MCENLKTAIHEMTNRIVEILGDCAPSIYLHGSCVMNDFRLGWSDIDILVLTEQPIERVQAEKLVSLRQTMSEGEPNCPFYRCFEGGMLTLDAFVSHVPGVAVYWGTSGQRITDRYELDACSMTELLDFGVLLQGEDVRGMFVRPSDEDLKAHVRSHLEAIRKYARKTGRSLYSFGWMLDISRGLYTLRTGKIISKTAAGEWALREGLCPVAEALTLALEVRREPMRYRDDAAMMDRAAQMGDAIQCYADVLERELDI